MKIFQVDAFTDKAFQGNPAGVCILEEPRDDAWMQHVAAEMNLSETAFLRKRGDGYHLRWFTPTVEVELCGHATLAGAHILWEREIESGDKELRFETLSGILTATRDEGWIELNFPLEPATETAPPANLLESLGVDAIFVGKNRFDYLVEVKSEETVRGMAPDCSRLGQVSCRGIIVTSLSHNPEYDFVSRFFAPAAGINEDPVTGSAHCCLGPYWQDKLGKKKLYACQASKRGGFLTVRIAENRTHIAGQAVTVMSGELLA